MSNKIFIYPTDTVWGIGGNAYKEETYIRISQIKKSPVNKPLSILFSSVDQLSGHVELSDSLQELILELMQYEITFGLDKSLFKNALPGVAFSETDFVCIRVLDSEIVNNIISDVKAPITTTSLNITGEKPITDEVAAKDFWKKYASDELIVTTTYDKEVTGNSSTIVVLSGSEYKFLRKGSKHKEIEEVLQKYLHYHA